MFTTSIDVKWIDILTAGSQGIQLWTDLPSIRDFQHTIVEWSKQVNSDSEELKILSYLFEEISCDTVATMSLLSRFYLVQNNKKKQELQQRSNSTNNSILSQVMTLNNALYSVVNNEIESTFEKAVKLCYTDFCELSSPIIDRNEIMRLVTLYKTKLHHHYLINKHLYGFDKKENMQKNKHLALTGFYDRLLFYQYLTYSRIKFNHNFTYWGIINTCAIYGRGSGKNRYQSASFFGHATTLNTLMSKTKFFRDNHDSNIHIRL